MFIMTNYKKGFTLTEVIIVLVIIAALALILVPNIMKAMPDDHSIKYKKAFYTIQEIVSDIANDPNVCQGMFNDGAGNWSVAKNPDDILNLCYKPDNTPRNMAQEICNRLQTTSECSTSNIPNINNVVNNGTVAILTTNGMRWNLATIGGTTRALGSNNIANQHIFDNYDIYVDVDGCGNNNIFNLAGALACVGNATNANNGVYGIRISSKGRVIPFGNTERNLLFGNPTD